MRSRITLIFVTALVTAISGCCIRFSNLWDSPCHVGDTFVSSGTSIAVEQFQWGNDEWTTVGTAVRDTRNYSRGSGDDVHANNVNLRFLFDYPVEKITLNFGDLGGNINIKVNDDFRNERDLVSLNGTTIGGVQVTVNAVQEGNHWYGKFILEGDIDNFVIGGQELWIDDVCHSK